jgi:hypothetical protein
MITLMNHLHILIKLVIYVLSKFKSGKRFSVDEKSKLLSGLYTLGFDFFSRCIPDDDDDEENKLGASWLAVSAHDNLCLPEKPHNEDEKEISQILQSSQVCTPMSSMLRGIRPHSKRIVPKTHEKYRNSFKVARRSSQSS